MIGNDIVDLKKSPSNWRRPRFLNKVFTQKEQGLIFSSENQHEMMWLLWSLKEAAYKCHVKQFGNRFFNPIRLVSDLISDGFTKEEDSFGTVRIDNDVYYTKSILTEDYIYTVANLNSEQSVKSLVFFKTQKSSYFTQSSTLKQHFIKWVSESRQIASDTLNIEKTELGIPQLFSNFEKLPIDFSLTHCGAYSAFVIDDFQIN